MTNRPVNDKQRQVLDWLATGKTQDPPTPEMKLSAAALKTRGLVKVRRTQGKWTAELTNAGRHYVEHGDYPPSPEPAPRAPRKRRQRTSSSPTNKSAVADGTEAGPEEVNIDDAKGDETSVDEAKVDEAEVPLRQVIRRPHPAVKELRDRPGRLPKFAMSMSTRLGPTGTA